MIVTRSSSEVDYTDVKTPVPQWSGDLALSLWKAGCRQMSKRGAGMTPADVDIVIVRETPRTSP